MKQLFNFRLGPYYCTKEAAMNTDPHYAREQLADLASSLETRRTGRRWGAKAATRLESDIVQGMYLVQKLFASESLSETALNSRMEITIFDKRKRPNDTNTPANTLYDLYKMNHPVTEHLPSPDLSRKILNNSAFQLCLTPGRLLTGVFVGVGEAPNHALYLVSIDQVIQIFKQAANP